MTRVDLSQVGLIGFSGGASLVLALLAEDSRYSQEKSVEALFKLGGIALSPVLNSRVTFQNLDSKVDEFAAKGLNEKEALTNDYWYMAKGLIKGLDHLKLIQGSRTGSDRSDLVRRFFNEFVHVDLKTTAEASHSADYRFDKKALGGSGDRHSDYYLDYGLQQMKSQGLLSPEATFDEVTSVHAQLDAVRAPMLLVFTADDPVLSNPNYRVDRKLPEEIRSALDRARANPAITVLAPEYGAHGGYYLDTPWLSQVIKVFFSH